MTLEISDAGTGAKVRTLAGGTAKGLNRVSWDLRWSPALPDSEAAAITAGRGGRAGGGGGRGGRGGRGGAVPAGPLVLPGRYAVVVKVPGVPGGLHGDLTVEGDPLTNLSDAERRARQVLAMSVYQAEKTLAAAHAAARALDAQSADLKRDLGAGGAATDSLLEHIARLRGAIERSLAATAGAVRPVESWSGAATIDQRRQIDFALEDANHAIADLNHVIESEIPASYAKVAKKAWPRPVAAVKRAKP